MSPRSHDSNHKTLLLDARFAQICHEQELDSCEEFLDAKTKDFFKPSAAARLSCFYIP